ncbi:DUF6702 family protein [Lewinella sp. W8]|uniref:DUF6702 family protein n=1 Tax=Lewinella sp. W8 TaxID=2528208 RepID=UPI0010686DA1|nr:DUF6702 family protein [Lewinella sp. W8]MTB51570.1 hypothetical protein [Lewinella sp. W8]
MKFFVLMVALLTSVGSFDHEYHVSKTNLRYVADRDQLQVEMHVFVDDLEKDLMAAGGPKLEIGTKREHPEAAAYLTEYLAKHFRVNWNGTFIQPKLLGYELEDDLHGLWIYLVKESAERPKNVTVENSMITSTYPDQTNIVKLWKGTERAATLLLSKDRPRGSYVGE